MMDKDGAMVEIELLLPEVNAAVSRHGWTVLHGAIWIHEAAFNTIISSKVKWLQWVKAHTLDSRLDNHHNNHRLKQLHHKNVRSVGTYKEFTH